MNFKPLFLLALITLNFSSLANEAICSQVETLTACEKAIEEVRRASELSRMMGETREYINRWQEARRARTAACN